MAPGSHSDAAPCASFASMQRLGLAVAASLVWAACGTGAPPNLLLVKNLAAMGVYWGSNRNRAPERLIDEFAELFGWFEAGQVRPHVSHRFDLADATQALELLTSRKSTGKVVLTTGREE